SAGGRPDARPVPVDVLLLGAGPRGVPGSARVGAVGRDRDGRRRRAGLRQAGAMSPLAWVPAVAVAVLTGHTLVNARLLRRPSPVVSPVDRRVSVLLPVRDEAHRVAACLESLLAQRGVPDLRVIVLDDGSSDGTAD